MSNEVTDVEICDDTGACSRQSFGPLGTNVISRAVTVRVVATNGVDPLTIRAFGAGGVPIVSGHVAAKPGLGNCGCIGVAAVYVDAAGIHLFGDG